MSVNVYRPKFIHAPEILIFFITRCVNSGLFKIPSVAISLFYTFYSLPVALYYPLAAENES